jgi:hypothetical protein
MSIDYTTLFGDMGAFIARLQAFRTYAVSTLPTAYGVINTQLTTSSGTYASLFSLFSDLPSTLAAQQATLASSWSAYMAGKCQSRLLDYATVVNELNLPQNPTVQQVLAALYEDMITNGQTIQKCTTTVSATGSPAYWNSVEISVFLTALLDGYSPPYAGAPVNPMVAGLLSELTNDSEVMAATCVQDSEHGSVAGQEQFQLVGSQPRLSTWDVTQGGSGNGPTITTTDGSGILTNGGFENWTSNTPQGWTITNGAAGTNVFQDTVTFFTGLSACKFVGSGIGTIAMSQQINQNLNALQMYCCTVYVLGNSGITGGTLTIELTGTGYSAGASEKIVLNNTALAALTSWTGKKFFVLMPAFVPVLSMTVSITGTLAGGDVWIDGMGFGPVTYFGGIGVAIASGGRASQQGDQYTWDVSNDNGGAFQSFFKRGFRIQLPSSASPSISDALVA